MELFKTEDSIRCLKNERDRWSCDSVDPVDIEAERLIVDDREIDADHVKIDLEEKDCLGETDPTTIRCRTSDS